MHLIIEIDPNAIYEFNRVAIRHPFTHVEPDLKQMIKDALQKPGHYIAKVSVSVDVVEFYPLQEPEVLEAEAQFAQEQRDYLVDFAA